MLQHNTQGQDAAEFRRLLEQLEIAKSVSRGMLMPAGKTGSLKSVKRLLGFVPGCLKVFAGLAFGYASAGPVVVLPDRV